jgi:ABC-type phosphate transport system substrate-binding protein
MCLAWPESARPTLMRHQARVVFLFALASLVPRVSALADDGYQVIVNAAATTAEAERSEVARFFLRQATKWSDGQSVLPVDQSARSPVRDAFSKGVLRQPLPAVESFWQRQIANGRAVPPPVKTTDAEVLAFVSSTPGSIGYVSGGLELTPGVKRLRLKE